MPAAEVAAESPHAGTTPGIAIATAVAEVCSMILKLGRHLAIMSLLGFTFYDDGQRSEEARGQGRGGRAVKLLRKWHSRLPC